MKLDLESGSCSVFYCSLLILYFVFYLYFSLIAAHLAY